MGGPGQLIILLALSILFVVASVSLGVWLWRRVRSVEERLRLIETRGFPIPSLASHVLEIKSPSPLAGMRVTILIHQDHPHPLFTNLLKEQLVKEDVSNVRSGVDEPSSDRFDLEISGELICNGYSDVYFRSEILVACQGEPICTVIERPPGGDRPSNLAIELVSKIKSKLVERQNRIERTEALRELRAD